MGQSMVAQSPAGRGQRDFQGGEASWNWAGTLFLIFGAGQVERTLWELGRGALTLLMLQKMMRRRTQKKTAMTPVPTRITISMLPLSSEPAWAETAVCACAERAPLLAATRSFQGQGQGVRAGVGGG